MKSLFSCLLLCAACGSASAGVIYNWHQLSASPTIDLSSGRIEITDAAWLSGHVNVDYTHGIPLDSPVIDLTFMTGHSCLSGDGLCPPISVFAGEHPDFAGYVVADLTAVLTFGDVMTGGIYAMDFQTQLQMGSGESPLWTIGQFRSEDGCFFGENDEQSCSGATGEWVLDPDSLPVVSIPEPGVAGLFGLGLLGLAVSLRRHRKRS